MFPVSARWGHLGATEGTTLTALHTRGEAVGWAGWAWQSGHGATTGSHHTRRSGATGEADPSALPLGDTALNGAPGEGPFQWPGVHAQASAAHELASALDLLGLQDSLGRGPCVGSCTPVGSLGGDGGCARTACCRLLRPRLKTPHLPPVLVLLGTQLGPVLSALSTRPGAGRALGGRGPCSEGRGLQGGGACSEGGARSGGRARSGQEQGDGAGPAVEAGPAEGRGLPSSSRQVSSGGRSAGPAPGWQPLSDAGLAVPGCLPDTRRRSALPAWT